MNRFGGQFASGVGGGQFTGAVWVIHCLSLSLAHSLPLTLIGGLGHDARCSLTISLSRSLNLPLTLTLACSQSPSHSLSLACRKLPPRPRISAANFPQGRHRTPKLDQRGKKKKKKLARIRRIPARFRRNPTRYRRNHC
jgi:hypothetical protein